MLTAKEIKEKSLRYNMQSWSKQGKLNPLVVEKSDNIYYWDSEGNRYTDMSSQLVNLNLGHGNREIVAAIKEQADKFCFLSPAIAVESRAVLADGTHVYRPQKNL